MSCNIPMHSQLLLISGDASLCGSLCFEMLKCCNSKLTNLRHEACAVLYLLMRSNYEFTRRTGINRVHLQVQRLGLSDFYK